MSIPRLSASRPSGARGPFVARTSMGWQTMLADLSLILFMVSAAAMAETPDQPKPAPPLKPVAAPADPARSEPLAVWRDGVGAPDLAAWLAQEQPDARQQLTITLRYRPADQAAALARGGQLASAAGKSKVSARIILEPVAQAAGVEAVAALAYDRGA